MSDNKGIHDGHRDRLRERFMTMGLDNFNDHQVLELLLFYGIPRKDTNEIAHRLIKRFGSLSAVLDAPVASLQECGLSYNCAVMIRLLPAVCSRYYNDKYMINEKNTKKTGETDLGESIMPYFIGSTEEQLFVVLLDTKGRVLFKDVVSKGASFASDVSVQKLLRLCVQHKANAAAVAHDHTNGILLPSKKDIDLIGTLKSALTSIGVILLEYYIIADMQCFPLSEDEKYEDLFY